jgi:AraC-type DNA-binding domain-containing proteins
MLFKVVSILLFLLACVFAFLYFRLRRIHRNERIKANNTPAREIVIEEVISEQGKIIAEEPKKVERSKVPLEYRIKQTIEQHYHDPEFNVEKLSEIVGISRVHLYRKMKEITDQPISHHIRDIRIDKAAELLKNSGLSVSKVAHTVGFHSISYFSTCFKDVKGITPKEYIHSNRQSEHR